MFHPYTGVQKLIYVILLLSEQKTKAFEKYQNQVEEQTDKDMKARSSEDLHKRQNDEIQLQRVRLFLFSVKYYIHFA